MLAAVGVDFGTDLTANVSRSLQVGADTVPVEGNVTMSCVSDRGCQ
ncbi:MAG: hypothetical protein H0V89_02495 [Deltaproteobacteria bacterium]|nr:hypothetical protein [Deltaproteobacteria bacterium]